MLLLPTVFSIISFTPSNAVAFQDILRLLPFSSFSTSTSSLRVLIFFLNTSSSFILNLDVLFIILLVSSSSFSMFWITAFLFNFSFILYCTVCLINIIVFFTCYILISLSVHRFSFLTNCFFPFSLSVFTLLRSFLKKLLIWLNCFLLLLPVNYFFFFLLLYKLGTWSTAQSFIHFCWLADSLCYAYFSFFYTLSCAFLFLLLLSSFWINVHLPFYTFSGFLFHCFPFSS